MNLPKKLQDKKDWALGQNDFGGLSNKIVALVLTASRNIFDSCPRTQAING